jgi:UDP-N-acetylmuramoyl-L-alanyl-D-glutamate--2,6-diaminopimelate ligase
MALPARSHTAQWLSGIRDAHVVTGPPASVSGVTSDSRQVQPGWLFVAIAGFETDGHRYLDQAVDRGATALLVQQDRQAAWQAFTERAGLSVVAVPDTRAALALAAAGFYGTPARKLGLIGVTGTDGKTTTTHLIAHVLEHAGRPAGLMSSISFETGGPPEMNTSHMTTLEAMDIQRRLAAMVEHGKRYAVVEASSHGLALHRVDACDFDVGVFTTLSNDHLDFHGTLDEYRRAKGRLFTMLNESVAKEHVPKAAVLNADDPASSYFRSLANVPATTYAVNSPADVMAEKIEHGAEGTRFHIRASSASLDVSSRLMGTFNVYNCLAAAAVALSQGVTLERAVVGLRTFAGLPGRMEPIDEGQPFRVIVDIASTPDALRRVLVTLRERTEGRLWAVFGAAGERDPGRRGGMGRAAGEWADVTVLTNEDPRREDPEAIIEQIAAGLREQGRLEGRDFVTVLDRRQALGYAFERASAGDTVLLAGKATEPSIVIGTEHYPWDERAVARECLRELGSEHLA